MLHLVFEESVLGFMKNSTRVGKAYFYQSIELISISRELAGVQREDMRNDLKKLILSIEETFTFTVKAKSSKLDKADDAMNSSTRTLRKLVDDHSKAIPTMEEFIHRMLKAKAKDEKAMKRKVAIFSKVRSQEESAVQSTKTNAEVFIYLDHDWKAPHVHRLTKLASDISLNVVLFRLIEQKIIMLRSNPYFYRAIPPRHSPKYHDASDTARRRGGLLNFTDQLSEATQINNEARLHVLIDRSMHISFEGVHTHRIFGNIWEYDSRLYFKDIRGHLLEADQLREELQMHEGSEIEMVTSPESRISYKWEDVLKEAKSAHKSIVFRPAAVLVKKPDRVDSGYLSNSASPISPMLPFSESSQPSSPLGTGRTTCPLMPSTSHIPPHQLNLPSKSNLVTMPEPDPNSLIYPPEPSSPAPPPMSGSPPSAASYHPAKGQVGVFSPRTHRFTQEGLSVGGSAKIPQPEPEPQFRLFPTAHESRGTHIGLRGERPLGTSVSQLRARPLITPPEPTVETGQGRAKNPSTHDLKPNSNTGDITYASHGLPKAIQQPSSDYLRHTDGRAVNTSETYIRIDDWIDDAAGTDTRSSGTSGLTQSSAQSQPTDTIKEYEARRKGPAPDDERQHAQSPEPHSYGPGQNEGTHVPTTPTAHDLAQGLSTKRHPSFGRSTNIGQALPSATNLAPSTHLRPNSKRSLPPDARQTNIAAPVSITSATPAHDVATRGTLPDRHQGQRMMGADATTSPSIAPSRISTPVQLESSTGTRNSSMQSVAPHQIVKTSTTRVELQGTKPSGESAAPGNGPSQTVHTHHFSSSPPSKKKSWFTRVVETVKGTVGWT